MLVSPNKLKIEKLGILLAFKKFKYEIILNVSLLSKLPRVIGNLCGTLEENYGKLLLESYLMILPTVQRPPTG